jgi:hypothetical protein
MAAGVVLALPSLGIAPSESRDRYSHTSLGNVRRDEEVSQKHAVMYPPDQRYATDSAWETYESADRKVNTNTLPSCMLYAISTKLGTHPFSQSLNSIAATLSFCKS